MPGPIRLLLADGQPLLRTGFRTVLGAEPDLDVVGEAGDGPAMVELTRRLLPDVVIMDIALPKLDGVAATLAITKARLPVAVIVLADPMAGDQAAVAALRAGARGLLARQAPPASLAAAIRAVAEGAVVVAPSMLQHLLDAAGPHPATPEHPEQAAGAGLTERERQVLVQVARGRSNTEIAQLLSVSETTVKSHVGHVLAKLGLRDRAQAVVYAYESGLVRPGA